MNFFRRVLQLMPYMVGTLMVLTVVLPIWHHFGMTRVLEVSDRSGNVIETRDDRGDQGASVATLKRGNGTVLVTCELIKKFDWPYCGFFLEFARAPGGVDLSSFDSFSVDMAYTGPGPHNLRAIFRNFEPSISTPDDWASQKINEIEFTVPERGRVMIPMKLLRTAPWWANERKIPLHETDVQIDNVTAIDLYTGSQNLMGTHRMELRSLKFHGKWISRTALLGALVAAWFVSGVLYCVAALGNYRGQLRSSKARLASLSGINRALQLEARELAGQAYTDLLTGALNRQGLRDLLMKQWKTPSLLAEPSSVMFVDLDHFKKINDQHGHDVGDDVLRSFAAMVRSEVRATDKLVRWGGEEFLIVCPSTDMVSAVSLAQKLRAAMEARHWPAGMQITASFGVTALEESEDIGDSIKRADHALYLAKSNGRNRVEVALRS